VEQIKPGFLWTLRERNAVGDIVSEETFHNLMPIESLNYMLSASFDEGVQFGSFYVGLFSGNYNPTPSDVMSGFPSASTEVTAYTSANRPVLVLGAIANGAVDNFEVPTEFTGTVDGTVARGGFISTSASKGGTTGPLLSAVRFPSPRTINQGSRLEVAVAFEFVSV
jgi:hypothetical protein